MQTAQHAFHSRRISGVGGVRIPIEQRLRGHDLTVLANSRTAATCSSIHRLLDGSSLPFFARPSSVVTSPLTCPAGVMHERIRHPSMITVQARTVRARSRNAGRGARDRCGSTYRRGVDGSASTLWVAPVDAQ